MEEDPGESRDAGSGFAGGRPELLGKPDRVVQIRKRAQRAKIDVPRYQHQREGAGRDREASQERQAPGGQDQCQRREKGQCGLDPEQDPFIDRCLGL